MKSFLVLSLAIASFSALASEMTPRQTVAQIEQDRNVKCEYVSSSLSVCIGSHALTKICRSSATYSCSGAEEFELKLKTKTAYDYDLDSRETVVTAISYN